MTGGDTGRSDTDGDDTGGDDETRSGGNDESTDGEDGSGPGFGAGAALAALGGAYLLGRRRAGADDS